MKPYAFLAAVAVIAAVGCSGGQTVKADAPNEDVAMSKPGALGQGMEEPAAGDQMQLEGRGDNGEKPETAPDAEKQDPEAKPEADKKDAEKETAPATKTTAPDKPEKPAPKATNSAAYVGKYKVDAASEMAQLDKALAELKKKADGGDEQAKQQLQMAQMQKTMMEGFLKNMALELRADKTWSLNMGEMGEMSGTYTAQGNKLTLTASKATNEQANQQLKDQEPQEMTYDPGSQTLTIKPQAGAPAGMAMPKFKKV